jgi:hypothetical protein
MAGGEKVYVMITSGWRNEGWAKKAATSDDKESPRRPIKHEKYFPISL